VPLLAALFIVAGNPTVRADTPQEVKVGVYVSNLFDVNFSKRDVEAQFWVWFDHSLAELDPRNEIDIINARNAKLLSHSREEVNGGYWDALKYSATLNETWAIENYPFDRQTIRISLESANLDARRIRFVPDLKGTKIRDDLKLEGWKIEGIRIAPSETVYHTAYGDPTLSPDGPSRYPRVTVEIDVKRNGWRLLLNTFIGFALAIALAGIVLSSIASGRLSRTFELGPQLSLGTGALFSTIGAGYILQNGLPATTEFSLADAFQLTAFFVTFLTMLSVFVVHVLRKHDRQRGALLFGRAIFLFYLSILSLIAFRVNQAVIS
jgi:hypothetical protein